MAERTELVPEHARSSCADAAEKLLQVGELAALVGKTVRAIHHYEELGLIAPDARSKGRFRLYDHDAVTRVRWISKLHDLGLSLTQIQDMVASFEHAPSAGRATAQVRALYTEKLAATREQIAHLRDLERELEESIHYLDACEPCDTTGVRRPSVDAEDAVVRRLPVMDAPSETRTVGSCVRCETRDREHEPELVAGLLRGSSEKPSRAKNSVIAKP
ncbi:MAG: MerR family transcriptional regulator [Polyangiaceae bacterium]